MANKKKASPSKKAKKAEAEGSEIASHEVSKAAGNPVTPEAPETPGTPGAPETSESLETPDVSEAPEPSNAPKTPEGSNATEPSEAAGAPEISEPPGQPGARDAPSEAGRELADWKEKYWRLAAEYDNYRKRTQRQRDMLYADAAADTAERFLPVYDNLERALCNKTEDTAYYKGVELIQAGLLDVLAKMNVRPIEALGHRFDPALHNAVMHTRDDSGGESTVVEVFQAGFIMGDRVIRHALVKVKN